jgi:hypothetical protein
MVFCQCDVYEVETTCLWKDKETIQIRILIDV